MSKSKLLSVAAVVVMMFVAIFALAACDMFGVPDDLDGPGNRVLSLNLGFFDSLVADITDATALGIRAESQDGERTFLYKTTRDFGVSAIEFDEDGLYRVTFRKNTNVTEDIFDSEGNLIDSNTTIVQSEIPAKINRFYVGREFTFIQYIPLMTRTGTYYFLDANGNRRMVDIEVRPDDNQLVRREWDWSRNQYILIDFDRVNFFSDELHKSFVIDNNTGFIYMIEDFFINEINNGLIRSGSLIYGIRINDDDELEFYSLFQNEMIRVLDFFRDNYGNNYIRTDSLNILDASTNTLFFSGNDTYLLSNEGYTINFVGGIFGQVQIMGADRQGRAVASSNRLTFDGYHRQGIDNWRLHIEDGYFYVFSFFPGGHSTFSRRNLETGYSFERSFGVFGAGGWRYDTMRSTVISHNKVLIWTDYPTSSGVGAVYWGWVFGENAHPGGTTEGLVEILPNNQAFDWGAYYYNIRFRITDLSGTEYWRLVRDEYGIPQAVKESVFVAGAQNVITLRPINR